MKIVANRYELLQKLGEGGMGTVYEAIDRLNKQVVAFKQMQAPVVQTESEDSTSIRVALAHEFQLLSSLHHPHIITVLDYGFDEERQPYFTMSLLPNPRTIIQVGRSLALQDKVRLLIEVLQALAYLHRRGIIHRDLKPDNALVDEQGEIRVLDFGIALPEWHEEDRERLVGTLAYMAPEVLMGQSASVASDLYAVGVMAYELFAGRHPFDTSTPNALIVSVLNTEPDVTAITTEHFQYETIDDEFETLVDDRTVVFDDAETVEILPPAALPVETDTSLASVIHKLLAKIPHYRYPNADSVIEALSQAIHQPLPVESAAIRESFLQAARFVGREKEFSLLMNAMQDAFAHRGSAWLIGGESGVGKSRLLDELRTRALVRGALVLRGQGVAEGGLPYQLWREPVRRMVISTDLTETEASVLKYIVPDIDDLLQADVPDAPELEGPAWQQRFLETIGSLFRKHTQPIVLVLEDLHWAVESLEVLKYLLTILPELPLLIIGSYRDDEKPGLPAELTGAEVIKLERLTGDSIEQLTVSMLGEVGRQPDLLELLRRETEGNVFFLVEVVRAMAEEAGRLSSIGQMNLPHHVSAGGIQQVIQRRLGRVPAEARPLLNLAAVAGRQLDLNLMQQLAPNTDLDIWLTECSNVAVIDLADGQWRFAHDKLREGLLGSLEEAERRFLHHQVALALEKLYGSQDDYALVIGDHYEQAGAEDEAVRWYVRAGSHAQASYVPGIAITYYQKALNFWERSRETPPIQDMLRVYDGLGTMLNWQARYPEAIETFSKMVEIAGEAGRTSSQVNAFYGIATAYTNQGDLHTAIDYLTQAENIARHSDTKLELSRILWLRGVNSYRLGDAKTTLDLSQQVFAISEELGNRGQMAQSLNLMGAVHYALGDYPQAAHSFEQAYTIFQELGDKGPAMSLVNNLGFLAEARGDYITARTRYYEALFIAREIGLRDAEMLYLSNLGGVQARLGDYFEAELNLRQVIEMAETIRFGQLSETYRFLTVVYLGQHKPLEALEAAQHALEQGKSVGTPDFIAGAWSVMGQVAAYLNTAVPFDANVYDAVACFQESDRIYQEAGMEGDRARNLREWARYTLVQGNRKRAAALWAEAKQLFLKVGADLEVQNTQDLP